jgi:iron(III) transport system permease protein
MSDMTAGARTIARAHRPALRPQVYIPLGILVMLMGYPIFLIVTSALNVGDPVDFPAREFGWDNIDQLLEKRVWIWNTLIISVGATVVGTSIGMVLAWILHRTTVPGRRLFEILIAIPYPLGPLVGALAWNVLGAPQRGGLINQAYFALTGATDPIINLWSISGIVFVMAIFEAPVAVLMIGAAMQRMDPSLEECSAVFGGGKLRTAMRVTLPLMAPAILSAALFLFVASMGSFAIPAILGAGFRFYVATTAIYVLFQGYPPNYPLAAMLGLVLIFITILAVWLNERLLRGRSYVVVGGRSYRPRQLDMGMWTWPLFAFAAFYVMVTLVLPLGVLTLASVQFTGDISFSPARWTLASYHYILFEFSTTRDAILNSLLLGVMTGTLGVLVATLIAWVVHRSNSAGRRLLEQTAMLPQAIPHLILAVGLLWMVLTLPFPLYGTIWAVLLAYLLVFLPLSYRSMSGVIVQIDRELEEAARVSGASWWRVMRTITIPLLRTGMTATWALLFMVSVREVSSSLFLAGPNANVLGPAIINFWDSGGLPRVSALAIVQAVIILVLLIVFRGVADRKT